MILTHGASSLKRGVETRLVFSTDFSNAYMDGEYLRGTSSEGINYSIRYATIDNGKALISNSSGDKYFPFSSLTISKLLNPKICVKYSFESGGGYVYAWIGPDTWGNDMFEMGPAFGRNVCMIKNVQTTFHTPNQAVTDNLRYILTEFTDDEHQVNEYAIKRNDTENKNEFYINDTLVFDCAKSYFNMNYFFGLQSIISCKIWEIKIYADV